MQEIPRRVISEANRIGFPIIKLPLDKTLGEISNESISHILEYKTEELRYALESHHHFSDIILQGKGLTAMINALSTLLGKPVMLFNQKQELLAKSTHFQNPPYKDVNLQILNLLPALLLNTTVSELSLLSPVPLRGQSMTIYPIHSYQAHGLLIVLEQSEETLSMHSLAIEQAVNVIRFEMLKTQAVKERSRRYKKEFFTDLIEGRYSLEQEVIQRGGRYGLTETIPTLCVIAKKDTPTYQEGMIWPLEVNEELSLSELDHLYNYLKVELRKRGMPCILFMKTDAIVLLFKFRRIIWRWRKH
ncbi:PucR family transcriptional regulator ligand-binding domain-containing protein [Paenibacillus sp. WQ 127069]|uniref:PucR family transcriptional regulator ligand-binding domain-containing protein n=2 Tax=Paenibacillus baimaensis TaxID=2982185 RepID=A0ABT2UCF0_9BACL|nr:PucR family transcriptional regulator ligand-binding domain-containing protein [Paenibacillus sp. WQ 127069]